MLVHNPWVGGVEGDSKDLRHLADMLDATSEAILDIYETETGMKRAELFALMQESRYMRGDEMVAKGFATQLDADEKAEYAIAAMLKESDLAFAATKETHMSKVVTRKEVAAELSQATDELAAVRTELADARTSHADELNAAKASHAAEIETMIAAHVLALAGKDAEIATAREAAKIVEAQAASVAQELAAAKAETDGIRAELAAAKAERAAVDAELAKAKAALKNPAIADAIMQRTTPKP
jgi:chromosome segregation ATPase